MTNKIQTVSGVNNSSRTSTLAHETHKRSFLGVFLCLIAAVAISFSSCSNDKNGDVDGDDDGGGGTTGGSSTTVVTYVEATVPIGDTKVDSVVIVVCRGESHKDYKQVTLVQCAPIGDWFKLDLPNNLPSNTLSRYKPGEWEPTTAGLVGVTETIGQFFWQDTDPKYYTEKLKWSNVNAKVFEAVFYAKIISYGKLATVGWFDYNADGKKNSESRTRLLYSESDVTVTGKIDYWGSNSSVYRIDIKKGWNWVFEYSDNKQDLYTTKDPGTFKWVFNVFN